MFGEGDDTARESLLSIVMERSRGKVSQRVCLRLNLPPAAPIIGG